MNKYIDFIHKIVPEMEVKVDDRLHTGYVVEDNFIIIGKDIKDRQCQFMRNLRKVHGCKFWRKLKVVEWVLLHEIGHYMTWDKLENRTDGIIRQAIMDNAEYFKTNEAYDKYFELPEEWEATEWAIRYAKENLI